MKIGKRSYHTPSDASTNRCCNGGGYLLSAPAIDATFTMRDVDAGRKSDRNLRVAYTVP